MNRSSLLYVAAALAAVATVIGGSSQSEAASSSAPAFTTTGPLTFDFVSVGSTSGPKSQAVANTGTAPLKIRKVTLTGRDDRDFKLVSDSCSGATVVPGASCSVAVVFAPRVPGTRVASLRFDDNTPCSNWINLAGSGTATLRRAVAGVAACDSRVQEALNALPGTVTTTVTPPSTTIAASSVVRLPSSKTCASRRKVTIRLTAPKGKTFKSVRIRLRGKTVKTLKGKRITARVSLRGLPRGRFTLDVRAVTNDGKPFVQKRHYVTCVATKD